MALHISPVIWVRSVLGPDWLLTVFLSRFWHWLFWRIDCWPLTDCGRSLIVSTVYDGSDPPPSGKSQRVLLSLTLSSLVGFRIRARHWIRNRPRSLVWDGVTVDNMLYYLWRNDSWYLYYLFFAPLTVRYHCEEIMANFLPRLARSTGGISSCGKWTV